MSVSTYKERVSPPSIDRIPSPLEFMRQRHPHLFSDSEVVTEAQIPRPMLDTYLETLTNRKQENEFEYFARLLAEKEICPNLRPQTGPTGGGDGKVDTETYPVAEEISGRWFAGDANAGRERWAFAFSTKKTWKSKVQTDVANILSTGRSYARIVLVTSRYARAKDRSDLEDRLTESVDIPVTIHDRSWILDKVYSNNHLELAARALNIDGYREVSTRRVGPNDFAREKELQDLDAQIADPNRYAGSRYALAGDCLQSALIARSLGRPQMEVEGRFAAAARYADEVGYNAQRLRVVYNRAWTAFFWYGDYALYNTLYDQVDVLALGSANAADPDLLFNLWQLLRSAVRHGGLSIEAARIEERGVQLAKALERIAGDASRPNNALQAQTSRLLMRATEAFHAGDGSALDMVWDKLREVVRQSEGLGSYSIDRLHDLLSELGQYVPESQAFDTLFDNLVSVIEKRRSESEGGKAYLERGLQKLEKGLPYDAIRLLGRAETRLVKPEYRGDLVLALLAISQAYQKVGLLWAARNKALVSSELLLTQFAEHGELDRRSLVPLEWLVWLELQLGRVPHVLATIELVNAVAAQLKLTDEAREKLADHRLIQEGAFGVLLFNTSLDQLRELECLPDALAQLGLETTRMALLWALGRDDAIRSEGYLPPEEPSSALSGFFAKWDDQPVKADLPAEPSLLCGDTVEMRSIVLGCEFVITAVNDTASVCLAESLLAVIESFLATSLGIPVMPYRERCDIVVRRRDSGAVGPEIVFNDELGATSAVVTHYANGPFGGAPAFEIFGDWLRDALISIVLHVMVIPEPKAWLEQVAGNEDGFSRAIALGNIAIATENVYGTDPKLNLAAWLKRGDRRYELRRDQTWNADAGGEGKVEAGKQATQRSRARFGRGPPPPGLLPEGSKHSQYRVASLIDIPLWNNAKWSATGFASYGPGVAPCLALAFRDFEAGKRIFEGWRARIGPIDRGEALRIAIITGIDRTKPDAYVVHVSRDLEDVLSTYGQNFFVVTSRINRMDAVDPRNLQRFLRDYADAGAFLLAPMEFMGGPKPQIDTTLGIMKSKLVIRRAWEIDEHDPDLVVIHADDEPVIPKGVGDVPVLRALARAREVARARQQSSDDVRTE